MSFLFPVLKFVKSLGVLLEEGPVLPPNLNYKFKVLGVLRQKKSYIIENLGHPQIMLGRSSHILIFEIIKRSKKVKTQITQNMCIFL